MMVEMVVPFDSVVSVGAVGNTALLSLVRFWCPASALTKRYAYNTAIAVVVGWYGLVNGLA